ncbi:anaerobic ribonucleoside-triphosphate reductase activating protein [uncultured Cardiobacterium sp.]|uniref:anaerobic ribonucleoside-triphosphate reductase activating protein n=1 Tax=uncultured Cardiobacterium sp. TaxID=417619 RepID=UPI0026225471|nr:anaerobic ribonucleoside-triphosphate reductase activating protein [uncultured Cardiobacterium sp.]
MLRYVHEDIVWQEVPGEVSLAYTIAGCPLRCPGCHSTYTWNPNQGTALTPAHLQRRIEDYAGLLSCVLFFGGEWHGAALIDCLRTARAAGLKTCLYTGLDEVPPALHAELTFLKTGAWWRERGGLDDPGTNQRFIRTADGAVLNQLFWRH